MNLSRNKLKEYGPAVATNLTREHSKVHTVDFSFNGLKEHGPAVAASLTREHSKVHTVNFGNNKLAAYSPKVAANLIGEHSKVQVVDFSWNWWGPYISSLVAIKLTDKHSKVHTLNFSNTHIEDDPAIVRSLTGRYSKIIDVTGVKLTDEQLNKNATNFFMQCSELSGDSLEGLAFKAHYEALRRNMSDKSLTHPRHIALLFSQGQTKGIMAIIKALLFHKGILKINDAIENNTDEIVERYIAENCSGRGLVSQVTEVFRTLIFSERRVGNNKCNQQLVEANERRRAAVPHQAPSGPKSDECNCPIL